MTFLTYNIQDGGIGRAQELFEILAAQNADVVLLQEVMDETPLRDWAARLGVNVYKAESNSPRCVALLTRCAITQTVSFHPPLLRHGALRATIGYAAGKQLTVFGLHLSAPAYTLAVELYRLRELDVILKWIAETSAPQMVVAGDLNSIAPGDAMDLSGLPRRVRASVILQGGLVARFVIGRMRRQGWVDCFRTLHPRASGFTLPPDLSRVRLDYFFVNDVLRPHLRGCEVVTSPPTVQHASDHLPVRMKLDME